MEYCKRTLDALLQEGPMSEATVWRMLRQLLIGLQHVHAQGIVHRDLKPQNIFLDFGDNCKLGDFGLATRRTAVAGTARGLLPSAGGAGTSASGSAAVPLSGEGAASVVASEATADVGTYLYMDPHAAGSAHSFALDIWSLGIILFELCTFFSTRMERIVALTELRSRQGPDAAFTARWPAQAALMREMLDPVPERRPSARKLLDRLPPQEDDENLKNALRVLSQPHSEYYALLMDNLFAPQRVLLPPAPQGDDDGLIPGTGMHRAHCSPLLLQPPGYMLALQRAHETLAGVYRRHGAVELTLPPLWLKQKPVAAGAPESVAAFLIESGGHVVGLHTGGRLPLCQYLMVSPAMSARRALPLRPYVLPVKTLVLLRALSLCPMHPPLPL
jgi:translation initiation factor 2-alpha kinase 4